MSSGKCHEVTFVRLLQTGQPLSFLHPSLAAQNKPDCHVNISKLTGSVEEKTHTVVKFCLSSFHIMAKAF